MNQSILIKFYPQKSKKVRFFKKSILLPILCVLAILMILCYIFLIKEEVKVQFLKEIGPKYFSMLSLGH